MIKKVLFTLLIGASLFKTYGQDLPRVVMECKFGSMVFEIDTINAPVTAHNFLKHVEKGTFGNAVFYRVVRPDNQPNNTVKIEVIQGGLFSDKKIEAVEVIRHETTRETGLKHLDGTISMARAEVGTASTEFFICIGDQPELDFEGKRNPDGQGFAAFGKVIDGMDVVRKIQQQKDKNQYLVEQVRISKIQVQ
jgi:peptidyl-prolyl cis-trans isomerase A (cyclophilin A)